MKNFALAVAFVLAAGSALADTKVILVNAVPTEVTLSASGGFYNVVDPVDAAGEPGLEARKARAVGQAIQALN